MRLIQLTAPGQIRIGDALVIDRKNGDIIPARAKEVLHPGTANEEVIYRKKKNHYFCTSLVLNGTSYAKQVFIVRRADDA